MRTLCQQPLTSRITIDSLNESYHLLTKSIVMLTASRFVRKTFTWLTDFVFKYVIKCTTVSLCIGDCILCLNTFSCVIKIFYCIAFSLVQNKTHISDCYCFLPCDKGRIIYCNLYCVRHVHDLTMFAVKTSHTQVHSAIFT